MKKLAHFLGDRMFGVCTGIANQFGFTASSVRMFFIYTSFLTLGSPIVLYLMFAFVLNMRKHLRSRESVWDF